MEHRNVVTILHITEPSQERPLVLAKLLSVGKLGICLALLKEIVRCLFLSIWNVPKIRENILC